MKALQFEVKGEWAHFKRPETNNNPLTHDMITKTALIGMIGAVLGIERREMKSLFPILSEDFIYNVQLLNPVKKISLGLTSRKAFSTVEKASPKSFEILRNPAYVITLALSNERSLNIFNRFVTAVKEESAIYTPILGWHNCPAEIYYKSEGKMSEIQEGEFQTNGFVKAGEYTPCNLTSEFRIGFDKLPTYQNDDFWNLPEKYVQVIYPDYPHSISVKGKYREYSVTSEKLCLI
ncbi:MAG: CRISPR-associated protein Cas5 [Paludibacteraceae bacterium]|nr:CRISPR-associated protein Cas5 [Paludibacteraceae bacterium]